MSNGLDLSHHLDQYGGLKSDDVITSTEHECGDSFRMMLWKALIAAKKYSWISEELTYRSTSGAIRNRFHDVYLTASYESVPESPYNELEADVLAQFFDADIRSLSDASRRRLKNVALEFVRNYDFGAEAKIVIGGGEPDEEAEIIIVDYAHGREIRALIKPDLETFVWMKGAKSRFVISDATLSDIKRNASVFATLA